MFDNYVNQLIFDKTFSFEDDSTLMLSKIPFVMFPAKAMATFIQETSAEMKEDRLNEIAYEAGIMVAEEFIEKLNWSSVPTMVKMSGIMKMLKVMGFGLCHMQKWDVHANQVNMHVTKHPVIEAGAELYGSNQRICGFYMAICSAHFHKELGIENCRFREKNCISKGGDYCEWVYGID